MILPPVSFRYSTAMLWSPKHPDRAIAVRISTRIKPHFNVLLSLQLRTTEDSGSPAGAQTASVTPGMPSIHCSPVAVIER